MRKKQFLLYFLLPVLILVPITTTWIINIIKGGTPYLDQWTRVFAESAVNPEVYLGARMLTELGSRSFLIPFTIIVALILLWVFRDWLPALLFSMGTLFSHLLNIWVKELIERDRPRIFIEANAEGYSFPSGHAMIPMVCYGFLMYLVVKKLTSPKWIMITQIFFSLLIFLIGLSRFLINVHYLTDVVAGFIFGFIFLIGLIYLYEFIQKSRLNKN